jgi:hypothetical protein
MHLNEKLLTLCLFVVAMSLTACSSLPFGSKEQINSLINVYAAGQYQMILNKDGKQLYQENWTCKAVEGKLPVCHMDSTRTSSVDVSGQVMPAPAVVK